MPPISHSEDPNSDSVRWGTVIALLSMDRVLPYAAVLNLRLPNETQFSEILRKRILQNRAAFTQNSTTIPDIKASVLEALTVEFGAAFVTHFTEWVEGSFKAIPQDHLAYEYWRDILHMASNDSARWEKLGFPPSLSEQLRTSLRQSFDLTEVHRISDAVEAQPLTKWDSEMYARHQLYAEYRDPEIWILNTVALVRFQSFIHHLQEQLLAKDLNRVSLNARSLAAEIPDLRHIRDLANLTELKC